MLEIWRSGIFFVFLQPKTNHSHPYTMVVFFTKDNTTLYAVDCDHAFSPDEIERLEWLKICVRPSIR